MKICWNIFVNFFINQTLFIKQQRIILIIQIIQIIKFVIYFTNQLKYIKILNLIVNFLKKLFIDKYNVKFKKLKKIKIKMTAQLN